MDTSTALVKKKDLFHRKELISLVGVFATPFAILLTVAGIVVADVRGPALWICAGLMVFSAFMNYLFPRLLANPTMERRGVGVQLRLILNVALNSVLVYYLGDAFRPMWLVLALTPFATAIYASRLRTLSAAFAVSAALLTIHVLQGHGADVLLLERLAYVTFMVLISLMINSAAVYPPSTEEILKMLKRPSV